MKANKGILVILFCVQLLVIVTGCSYEGPYTFRQDRSNIEKVEICEYNSATKTRTPIVELAEADAQTLVSELETMQCGQYGPGDHPRNYGRLMICITYADNEVELIGLTNIGWVARDGKLNLSEYCFNEREIFDLILAYTDPELLPDLSEDFAGWLPTQSESDISP